MKDSIQLSIILTTHAKSNHFNTLLSDVLQFSGKRIEVIIINDSSDVVTSQFIEREINQSSNEKVYLFEHSAFKGRGTSLNEALVHASGTLVWAPLRADRLNESLLHEAIRRYTADPAAFWALDYNLPENALDWIHAADEGDLPDDSCLVWNRNVISAEQFFFNPFLDHLHGAELAFRLAKNNVWYKTDPFFVVADDQSIHAGHLDIREMLCTALRLSDDGDKKESILQELADVDSRANKRVSDDDYLLEARQLLNQGDAKRSLELIDKFLKRNPGHHEGVRIKISSLEKLRRHVEAAELKHSLHKRPQTTEDQAELMLPAEDAAAEQEEKKSIELSVVIPTTGHGKMLLEATLLNLEQAVDAEKTELIIIDNASIDDTFDYLEQLKNNSFLNARIITNHTNRGFAASVNQGIEIANGEYVLVMHNDVLLQKSSIDALKRGFSSSDSTAVVAPVINRTTFAAQKREPAPNENQVRTDRVDSCCFMIKKDLPVRFDEEYQLCYFEMDDYCKQIAKMGLDVVVTRDTVVEHQKGGTTQYMGVDLNPELKWRNRGRFYQKWNPKRERKISANGTHPERFQKLGAPDNPMDPDPEWVQTVQNYLTNEVRTEILRGKWSEDELLTIILTLLIADERELLRTLEDRLEDRGVRPDKSLLMLFIHYYFKKNIFSRCKHYINLAEESHPVFDLYMLKIYVADKEFDKAIPLLNDLLEQFPSSPELFYLAGEMYKKSDDHGEAKSFFAMANQLDPYRFQTEDSAFEINI